MVQYTSGHAAVFDQYTMHAGGTYTKEQCNIDFSPQDNVCSICGNINKQSDTKCQLCNNEFNKKIPEKIPGRKKKEVKRYNVRLHLEVETSGKRVPNRGFNASACAFMEELITEFEFRAQKKEDKRFISHLAPRDAVLTWRNFTFANREAVNVFGWLNDNLIDFIVESSGYVVENKKIKYFSSLFFAKLKEAPPLEVTVNGTTEKIPQSLPESDIDFQMVRNWVKKDLRKVDTTYFNKEVILFPINQGRSHWYLVSFIQPKLLFESSSYSEQQQQPFVIVLDSLLKKERTQYEFEVEALKKFLYESWLENKNKETDEQLLRKLNEVPTVFPDCPQQPNSDDCGVHVAKHAKNIARKFQHLKLKKNEEGDFVLDYNLCEDLTQDVSSERKYLMNQLMVLIGDYQRAQGKVIHVD